MYKRFFKRLIDIIFSAIAIVLLAIPMGIIACVIKKEDPGPALFKQQRIGKYKRLFPIYKFRSMRLDTPKDVPTHLLDNPEQYLLKSGRFLRKSSLDELPQLFNVLVGDMSLVGPRPPLPDEVKKYTLEDRKRLNVRPGITCIWQTSGRSDTSFQKQVELDKEYIASKGLLKDLWILIKTIPAVFSGRGAY